jgi:mannosyltransferase OCH1-like enzyme
MINNNIHQIWVGDKKIPSHIKDYMDEVKELHPKFNYYLWNDDNLPELPQHLKEIYDAYEQPAVKADLLRMYVVHKFGGIYLDADLKTINGLNTNIILHEDYDGFISYNNSYGMSALANTIFGFSKNNKFLEYMIDNIIYKNQWIGPNWWSQIVCKHLNLNPSNSTLDDLKNKVKRLNLQIVDWKDIEDKCFKHEALASWIHGSDWNEKFKNGDYD